MVFKISGPIQDRDGILCLEGKEFRFHSYITESAANGPKFKSMQISAFNTKTQTKVLLCIVGQTNLMEQVDLQLGKSTELGASAALQPLDSWSFRLYFRLIADGVTEIAQTHTDILSYQITDRLDTDIERLFTWSSALERGSRSNSPKSGST